MKKYLSSFLAVFLSLILVGCGNVEDSPITGTTQVTEGIPVQTQDSAETTVSSVFTAPTESTYPQTIETEISLEGTPMTISLNFFDGGNYVIYIPEEDWVLETNLKDGYLTDTWYFALNKDISFSVVSYGNLSPQDVQHHIADSNTDFTFDLTGEDMSWGKDMKNYRFLTFSVRSDGKNTFALIASYPMEAGDGISPRVSAIADSFQIK